MEAELNDPTFYARNLTGTHDHMAKLDAKKAELETKFMRWSELEEVRVAAS